jgi:hypothetical protein
MSTDQRDILEVLKFELDFLEQGGYGRSVRTPWRATSSFQDSPSCLNFNDPERPHPCSECLLIDFVPPSCRAEDVPCHHIPVGPHGEALCTLEQQENQAKLEDALRNWLRAAISRIEQERAEKKKLGTGSPSLA